MQLVVLFCYNLVNRSSVVTFETSTNWWTTDGSRSTADDTAEDWKSVLTGGLSSSSYLCLVGWNSNDTASASNVMYRVIHLPCISGYYIRVRIRLWVFELDHRCARTYTQTCVPADNATVKLISRSTVNIDAVNTWLPLPTPLRPQSRDPDRPTWRPKFDLLDHNTQNYVTSLTVHCFHVLLVIKIDCETQY